jgi:hypothetical protein
MVRILRNVLRILKIRKIGQDTKGLRKTENFSLSFPKRKSLPLDNGKEVLLDNVGHISLYL